VDNLASINSMALKVGVSCVPLMGGNLYPRNYFISRILLWKRRAPPKVGGEACVLEEQNEDSIVTGIARTD